MIGIIKRLGFYFWFDCMLVYDALRETGDVFFSDTMDLSPNGRIVSSLIALSLFSLSFISSFFKGPDRIELLKDNHLANCWKISIGILIFSYVLLIVLSYLRSYYDLDPDFTLRALLLYSVSLVIFISFQVYFLVKNIW